MAKIGFYGVREDFGCFSNWFRCKFTWNNQEFTSSEQALMYAKADTFKDEEIKKEILQTTNNKRIKELGRLVHNFDSNVWRNKRYSVMVDILYSKFSQNEKLKEILLSTNDSEILECSPTDKIWGIGSKDVNNVRGENLLGKSLMEVRSKLQNEK